MAGLVAVVSFSSAKVNTVAEAALTRLLTPLSETEGSITLVCLYMVLRPQQITFLVFVSVNKQHFGTK